MRRPEASNPAPTEELETSGAARTDWAALVRWGLFGCACVILGLLVGLFLQGWRPVGIFERDRVAGDEATSAGPTGMSSALEPTESPSPTVVPAPTPTQEPVALRLEAERAAREGDFASAAEAYASLADRGDSDGHQARLGLGEVLIQDGQYQRAATVLRELVEQPEGADAPAEAEFLLAEALVAAGEPLTAVDHYRAYLDTGTVITGYVQEAIGDAFRQAGSFEEAAAAYEAAVAHADDRSRTVGLMEKAALAHAARAAYSEAIGQYDAILDIAEYPGYRAYIEHQAAETAYLAGRLEDAVERYQRVVQLYPEQASAHASLVRLIEEGVPVDDRLRGIVDFHAGAYEPGVLALVRYYMDNPTTHNGDAHWFAGASYLALGDTANAAREFRLLIDTHPGHELVDAAWIGLAEAYAAAGETAEAVYTYWRFAEVRPSSERAPEALWEAAVLLERSGDLAGAVEAFVDCQARYPDADAAAGALFRSGLSAYRLGNHAAAATAWELLATVTETGTQSAERTAGLFWLGKLRLQQGDDEGATRALRAAAETDPLSYYGIRAEQLATDAVAAAFPVALQVRAIEEDEGRPEAEAWLGTWSGGGDPVGGARQELLQDMHLQRGLELWSLGRLAEGRGELEALRTASADAPLDLYHLALLFREIGLFRSSLLCAARIIHLSPAETVLEAPPFIARLAYPDYYHQLVTTNAADLGLDPLLVFSVIRQESLFESLATSSAAAHGLMQVIPSTGAQIAASLAWPPDYETPDLYRAYVSVRFGTYYLAVQLDRFDGREEVALAAYNGGPGNAITWRDEAGSDPDLFLEAITFGETRRYVSRIREQLAVYRALYGEPSSG